MSLKEIQNIFSVMSDIASNPGKAAKAFKQNTKSKVVGCFPYYCPEELVHAAGMLPIGCWGGQTTLSKSGYYFPPFACSLMHAGIEFAMNQVYEDLSAAIIPAPCDTLKQFGQDWITAAPNIPAAYVVYPLHKTPDGVKYLKEEFTRIREWLENLAGEKITDESLHNSIQIYNENKEAMREFAKVAAEYPDIVTPYKRHLVFKSRFFMEKSQHTVLVKKLITLLTANPRKEWKGTKVILSGIMLELESLLETLAQHNIAVVGDDLAQESRQIRANAPDGKDPLERLAAQWLDMSGCSLIYDTGNTRAQLLIDMTKQYKADGVIFSMMKFCEPEEFDYPLIKKDLEQADIPVLSFEIEQQMQSIEQIRTRLQAFKEMLASKV
ncbi:2-hydroxyacyl-CoA dehydratase family protein [Sporomusa sphaeroides DSM 2875]|uniref:2-hydroxyacyl-CoA dehydratase subunit D n=1 Tax=Sporomusa sphaeroides TaxID=47679 RepID=UPI002030DF00|nr:2-hydroxyacyl-CoA dehydratase family protein [Sporomusa sphaeroides]MCM0759501.1 2-hydroxyacyl-CoA dehydratase family protein [Sporomusa sphaeroides DSM 2875]